MADRNVIIHVEGKVQGVYFRQSTRSKATQLGVRGSVRNLADGKVKIHAGGAVEAIDALIEWCHEGPPAAQVSAVLVEEADPPIEEEFIAIR